MTKDKDPIELELCPFCNDAPLSVTHEYNNPYSIRYNVVCECGSEGAQHTTEQEATKAWNTRAISKITHVIIPREELEAMRWVEDESESMSEARQARGRNTLIDELLGRDHDTE